MSRVTVKPNFEIHFEVEPGVLKHPTLFLHGNLASRRWWYPLRDLYKADGPASHEMILMDWRGCGLSDAPKSEEPLVLEEMGSDVLTVLKDQGASPSKKFGLVGHSTGGLIALEAARQAPDLIDRVFLLDSVGANGVTFDDSMLQAFDQMTKDKALTAAVIGSTIKDCNTQDAFFQSAIVEDAFKSVGKIGIKVLKMLEGLDYADRARSIGQRVVVTHGEFDELLSKDDSKKLAEVLPNAKFVELPGRGHCANIESPTELKQWLDNTFF